MDQPSEHKPTTPAADEQPRRTSGPLDALGLFSRGLAMGAADIVPGVSGGTIALISGVYERFIAALGSLSPRFAFDALRGDLRSARRRFFQMHWGVLAPLFAGIVLSVLALSKVIPELMDDHPGPTYAFFFGLIAAAVWVPFARMNRRTTLHVFVALVAAAGAYAFVGAQPQGLRLTTARADDGATVAIYAGKLRASSDVDAIVSAAGGLEDHRIDRVVVFDPKGKAPPAAPDHPLPISILENEEALDVFLLDAPPLVVFREARGSLGWIFLCGVIGISAMVLPGVSGAFLLLFMGQYHAVLTAIHQVIGHGMSLLGRAGDPIAQLGAQSMVADVMFLGVFGVGVVLGLGAFSRAVNWLLMRAHDVTMAALTGLMIGALRQPGREVLAQVERIGEGESYWPLVVLVGALGGGLVTALNWLDSRIRSRRAAAS